MDASERSNAKGKGLAPGDTAKDAVEAHAQGRLDAEDYDLNEAEEWDEMDGMSPYQGALELEAARSTPTSDSNEGGV